MKKLWSILAGVLFMVFLMLTLYPLIGQAVNQRYQSEVYAAYHQDIRSEDDTALEEALQAAYAYNATLVEGAADAFTQEAIQSAGASYEELLNQSSSGIMGYVDIPAIAANLPIYHGTGKESLDAGLGHLLGTSLPVGGTSTHSVLSGHTGLASQKMLTDLDKLRIGDRFYLEVLGEVLTYEVDSINIVLPHETELLRIIPGEDHVTLLTCTPYAVNSHRLLVRGTRVLEETTQPAEQLEEVLSELVTAEVSSTWEEQYIRGILYGAGFAAVLLVLGGGAFLTVKLYKRRHAHEA